MKLPEHVLFCLDRLENASFSAYAVGGCVRDDCLGLTPHDYDLCTNAKPEQIQAIFRDHGLVLAGVKHGTVGVITEGGVVEITTYRTEGDYQDNRHPGWVEFVDDIRGDLARRDFTVNAMAWSPRRGFADPFGGRLDLDNKILRTVGDPVLRFREDSLRILRGVRFAARYSLTPDPETEEAMFRLAPLMDNLARERAFDELCKLLLCAKATDLIRFAPVITQVIPELAPAVGFDQKNHHHIHDIFSHTAYVVENAPQSLTLRWAALLHDVAKPQCFTVDEDGVGHFYGHAGQSAELAEQILLRLKAPTSLRQEVALLIRHHMTLIPAEKKAVRRWLGKLGQETFFQLLDLQLADTLATGTEHDLTLFDRLRELAREILEEQACLTVKDLAINGRDLMALGFTGPAIGHGLNLLLEQVMDETLENTKDALLRAATALSDHEK